MEKLTSCVTKYDENFFECINKYWTKVVKLIRAKEFFAELFGTFMFVVSTVNWLISLVHSSSLFFQLIGDGAIAHVVTSKQYSDIGGLLSIYFAYGIGLMVALYVSIGVSGGHLNPAVTLAMALRGKTSWLKVQYMSYLP